MDIQIISGFLGAGKTTFINRYLPLLGGKVCIIENEFGDISLDGSLIEGEAEIREITSGCICCTLSGDFRQALTELKASAEPDHILIEPTGVGRLSDVLNVCRKLEAARPREFPVSKCITIVDVSDYEANTECFGDFYTDQIRNAAMLYLTHTENRLPEEIDAVCADIKKQNPKALVCRDDFRGLDDSMFMDLIRLIPADRGDPEEESHHDHEDDDDEHDHDHHHHHHDHDHRDADDIFSTAVLRDVRLNAGTPEAFIEKLQSGAFGQILRGKGYIKDKDGSLLYADVTPGGCSFRKADPEKAGDKGDVFILIGCGLDRGALYDLRI